MDFTKNPPKIASIIPNKTATKTKKAKSPITSISFHEDGQYLYIASSLDNRLRMIDCASGSYNANEINPFGIQLMKDGARLVQATHDAYSVLTSGTPSSHEIQNNTNAPVVNYVSLYDNQILRTFHGHTNEVTNISMCPIDDRFLTSSMDGTVRLWTLQQAGCLGKMELPGNNCSNTTPPYAIFDSTGLVFGIMASMHNSAGHYVHLYDSRNYTAGAFAELVIHQATLSNFLQTKKQQGGSYDDLDVNQLSNQSWCNMSFNNDGTQIVVTSFDSNIHWLLDGYDGTIQNILVYPTTTTGKTNVSTNRTLKTAVYTPDDKYVVSSNGNDNKIYCWDVSTGQCVHTLENKGVVDGLGFNPKYAMMASVNVDTMLWIW